MLQAGGIDKLVEQKADAYRGNPQALQKRYSQNQELMDLLAMQKLKTEKEAASRDMQLKAEQTPSTIAEQYEQQLVGMNKDEMAGQVAGVLGQKQKQAQQKQQAMGMPQGAPQGIASQPRPNMQGMAQGGIVGYQEGGLTSISDAEVIAFLKKKYGKNLTGSQLEAVLKPERIASEKESMMRDAARARVEKEIPRDVTDRSGKTASAQRARTEELLGMPTVEKPRGTGGLSSAQSSALQTAMTGAPATGTAPAGTGTVLAPNATAPATTAPATGGIAATAAPAGQPPAGFGASSDMSIDQQLQGVLNTAAPDTSTLSKKTT